MHVLSMVETNWHMIPVVHDYVFMTEVPVYGQQKTFPFHVQITNETPTCQMVQGVDRGMPFSPSYLVDRW